MRLAGVFREDSLIEFRFFSEFLVFKFVSNIFSFAIHVKSGIEEDEGRGNSTGAYIGAVQECKTKRAEMDVFPGENRFLDPP